MKSFKNKNRGLKSRKIVFVLLFFFFSTLIISSRADALIKIVSTFIDMLGNDIYNIGNLNATGQINTTGSIYQNNIQVIDTLTQDAPITVTGTGNSRTIDITVPTCTGTDKLTSTDGNSFSCTADQTGTDMPRPDRKVWGLVTPGTAAAATIISSGILSGTATGAGGVTDSNDNDGRAKNILTGTTAGNTAKISTTLFTATRRRYNPTLIVKMKHVEFATERVYVGFTSAAFANSDNLATTHFAAIRASTVAGDAQYQFCTADGTTQSCVASSTNIVANTVHIFKIRLDDSGAQACFSIDGGTETCKATNPPAQDTNLGAESSVITTDTNANNQKFYYMYIEQ